MAAGWLDKIRRVAPGIGKALGLAGVPYASALGAVSQALLGKPDATQAEIEERIANWTPADELAMQAAEQKFTLEMIEQAVSLEKVAADDRANARARETATKDWTARTLAISIFTAFFGLLILMVIHAIPVSNERPFDILLGMLGTGVISVLQYYFGGSAGSDIKTAIMGRVIEKRT